VTLSAKVKSGDLRAAARLLRLADDQHSEAQEAIAEIYRQSVPTRLIGITGSPGAGKSTLIDGLIAKWREQDHRVAVIAVDPSSPITGGAILGDRVRMQKHVLDEGVFIRSLANRGQLGGLSASVASSVVVFEGLGFERILVETVGIGQSEVDIAQLVETTVVVMAPGLGDDVQALKAGLMEVADIFVVNKSDRPGATQTVRDIEQEIMASGRGVDSWMPKVLKCNALDGSGVEELLKTIDEHRTFLEANKKLEERHRSRARFELEARIFQALKQSALEQLGGAKGLEDALLNVADRKLDAKSLCDAVLFAARVPLR
jgi:LAO/AO transport system kinase